MAQTPDNRQDQTSDGGTPPIDESGCPKCGAARLPQDSECGSCGIVYAKWFARQKQQQAGGSATGGRRETHDNRPPSALVAAMLVLLAGGAAAAWNLYPLAPAQGEDILVSFENGVTCRLSEWTFRYRRAHTQTQARGNVLIVGRTLYESTTDDTLRIFAPNGDKLTIPGMALREINITSQPDEDNRSRRRVLTMSVAGKAQTVDFTPQAIPRLSRSRLLIPEASHYFPERYDDDYIDWHGVSVWLSGRPSQECKGHGDINLTAEAYPRKWTPKRLDFPDK
jgi:hypothetical protein